VLVSGSAFALPPPVDSPQALKLAAACENNSDARACQRTIKLGLSPQRASMAYTFWADSLSNQPGINQDATKLFLKAIALDPNNALATYLFARLLPMSTYRQFEERRSWLLKAERLRPDWDGIHAELAGMSTPEEGLRELQKAVELAPDDPIYPAGYEEASNNLKDAQKRMQQAEAKMAADPKTAAILVEYEAKFTCDVQKAEHYEIIAEKYYPNEVPQITLATVYRYCLEFEKSRALYRQVLASMEARLNTGLTYQEAIEVEDEALQFLDMNPELKRIYLLKAAVAERDQKWWLAQVYLEKEIAIAPSGELYAHYARVMMKQSAVNKFQASQAVAKGMKLDPKFIEHYPDLAAYAPEDKKK